MATMIHRTTFALDEATTKRLKKLSRKWNVSQAEVVRRAVGMAESSPEPLSESPIDALRNLHRCGGGLVREVADQYLIEVEEDRRKGL